MYKSNRDQSLFHMLKAMPDAVAVINGSDEYRTVRGTVKLFQGAHGVLVIADVVGLPIFKEACKDGIFAFHIHSGSACTGNASDPFANAGSHYNPDQCPHPYHAGDMPPLFSAGESAFLAFVTDRFTVSEVVSKTVVIHDRPDDFTTQPSGNAGNKIACGVIERVKRD